MARVLTWVAVVAAAAFCLAAAQPAVKEIPVAVAVRTPWQGDETVAVITLTFAAPVRGLFQHDFQIVRRSALFNVDAQLQRLSDTEFALILETSRGSGASGSALSTIESPESFDDAITVRVALPARAGFVTPPNAGFETIVRFPANLYWDVEGGRNLVTATCASKLSGHAAYGNNVLITSFLNDADGCCVQCQSRTDCAGYSVSMWDDTRTPALLQCQLFAAPVLFQALAPNTYGFAGPASSATCGALPIPKFGALVGTCDTYLGTSCTVACGANARLTAGDVTRQCIAVSRGSYEWTGVTPTCTYDCGTFPIPSRGSVVGTCSSTLFGTSCTTQCDASYALTGGNFQRTCTTSGWSGATPTCTYDCGTPTAVTNGAWNCPSTTAGGTCTIQCATGYVLKPGKPASVTCSASGWSTPYPECVRDCGGFPVPAAATSTCTGTSNLQGASCTSTCNSGYVKTAGDATRTCNAAGWSGAAAVCTRDCGAITPPDHSSAQSCSSHLSGAVCTLVCDEGYTLSAGNLVRTCFESGWSGLAPTCTRDCGNMQLPRITTKCANTLQGTTCQAVCDRGYHITSGQEFRTCQADGTWSGTNPVCGLCSCQACQRCDSSAGCVRRAATENYVCHASADACLKDAICSGDSDDCPNAQRYATAACTDFDGDGYAAIEDCNDANPAIYPGAPEPANQATDYNCDGITTGSSLNAFVGAAMAQMIRARQEVDQAIASVAKSYLTDPYLQNFPVPWIGMVAANITIPVLIGDLRVPTKVPVAPGVVDTPFLQKKEALGLLLSPSDLRAFPTTLLGQLQVVVNFETYSWTSDTAADGSSTLKLTPL